MYDVFPKRRQCQFSHFEMLVSERDADNGDAKQYAEKQMGQANT